MDGGPAFPVTDASKTQCPGMTLRDWFAGQALSILPAWEEGEFSRNGTDRIAAHAYMIADAMLAERHRLE